MIKTKNKQAMISVNRHKDIWLLKFDPFDQKVYTVEGKKKKKTGQFQVVNNYS